MKNVIERMQEPTPKFFRVLRNTGIVLTALSGALLSAPVLLPAAVVSVAGYLAVAGAVAGAVSQAPIFRDE